MNNCNYKMPDIHILWANSAHTASTITLMTSSILRTKILISSSVFYICLCDVKSLRKIWRSSKEVKVLVDYTL